MLKRLIHWLLLPPLWLEGNQGNQLMWHEAASHALFPFLIQMLLHSLLKHWIFFPCVAADKKKSHWCLVMEKVIDYCLEMKEYSNISLPVLETWLAHFLPGCGFLKVTALLPLHFVLYFFLPLSHHLFFSADFCAPSIPSLCPLSSAPVLLLLPVGDQRGSFTLLSSFHNTGKREKRMRLQSSQRQMYVCVCVRVRVLTTSDSSKLTRKHKQASDPASYYLFIIIIQLSVSESLNPTEWHLLWQQTDSFNYQMLGLPMQWTCLSVNWVTDASTFFTSFQVMCFYVCVIYFF